MRKFSVIIVEDEKKIARYLKLELEHEGYVVDCFEEGKSALEFFERFDADIILLDLMLPGMDGLEILRRIRDLSSVPVIIISARDEIKVKVEGLDIGADDYMTKPFQIEELLARMRSKLQKKEGRERQKRLVLGDLNLDLSALRATYQDEVIDLTKREFELLKYLIERRGEANSREDILKDVWGYDYAGETNVVDVYIRYLRQKIEDKYGVKIIRTIRGVGYGVEE